MQVSLKQRVHDILEVGEESSVVARVVQGTLFLLILLNVTAVVLETVASIAADHGVFFLWFEIFSVAVFTVEYVMRLWACTSDRRAHYRHPVTGRLRYAGTPFALIDLMAILPFYLSVILPVDLRFMRAFRLLRVLKLTRYSTAVETLGAVVYNERRALAGTLLIMMVLLVIWSSLVYFAERKAQPEAFASIPHAMWWGLASLTTVGYGDMAPVTLFGRLLGGFTIILGVVMFALPAGILASGFAEELRRRNFVVTWNLVASVPLFSTLPAARIADIAALLQPRVASAGETIFRQGEPADDMYFIVTGEVDVDLAGHAVQLHEGEFFGELALLQKVDRRATVTARSQCQLLALEVDDFERLMASEPELKDAITRIAEERALPAKVEV